MRSDPSMYTLIIVTMTITEEILSPGLRVERFRDLLVHRLMGTTQQVVHVTLYRHAPDAQPDVLPKISKGEDGRGEWVICALISGDKDRTVDKPAEHSTGDQYETGIRGEMLGSIEEWRKGLEKERALKEVDLKIGVWKGDIFMS
jgi:hypothetical protein